ncbi:uncharacterized protein LOC127707693 [Mytilus californianus]|uniref:uncharacterized protein LOC127707693 n=1 Tax=Mytilus californianus TaxID=6549 RepID=UPI00224656B9|nr:uncharacterized protein LOC127707693 [Mytilus californianus]XP_052068316.1 uncharacterized protein LOC127707693 [Mytilus californianus]
MEKNISLITDLVVYGIILILSWYMYKMLIKPFLSPLRAVPGLAYYPIVGNMLEARRAEAMTNALRWMTQLKSKLIRFYWFGGQERLLTGDPKVFQHILVTNSKNYHRLDAQNNEITTVTGSPALFVLSGEHHHMMRKICNPGFVLSLLHTMIPVFQERGNALFQLYNQALSESRTDTADIDIQATLSRLTLDVICQCGFQYDLQSLENPKSTGVMRFRHLVDSVRTTFVDLLPFSRLLPTKKNKKTAKDREFIVEFTSKIIKEYKMQEFNENKHRDLLTSLMSARDSEGSGLSDKELFGQIIGFIFAGFDTTATAMTWILLQLAQYPEIQDKVRAEVNQVFPDISECDPEKLDKLKYLNCVIKETMRLFPPVPCFFRKSLHDDVINGYKIPAGTVVGLHVGALHRLNVEDGDTFRPERFLSPSDSKAFMPFGKGPYMCIGNKFAQLEIKTVISRLIKEFKFEWKPGFTFRRVMSITIRPHPSLVLRISKI